MTKPDLEFYFEEPFFSLGIAGQFFVRIILTILTILLMATAAVLLLSDLPRLFYVGLLLGLMAADLAIFRGKARFSLDRLPRRGRVNLAGFLAPASMEILGAVYQQTLVLGGSFYLRLNRALLGVREVRDTVQRLEVNLDEFLAKIDEGIEQSRTKESSEILLKQIKHLIIEAARAAMRGQSRQIMPVDLFAAQEKTEDKELSRVFNLFQINQQDLEDVTVFGRFGRRIRIRFWKYLPSNIGGFAGKFFGLRRRTVNRAWTSRPTPTLDQFSVDFTDLARAGDIGFMIGHEKEYDRLVNILSRPTKPNAILFGEPGVGAKTIIKHLAYMITKDEVPPPLFDKRLVALNISSLVAGADQAELQGRIHQIFEEIIIAENIILYIPEIHNLSRTSGEFFLSAANVMLPFLVSNNFPTIGSSYSREYKQYIERDSAFLEAFEGIMIEEISEEEAVKLLTFASIILEKNARITISFDAIKTAVNLAKRYFNHRPLPGPAHDLLKEAASAVSRKKQKVLAKEDVIQMAEMKINVPLHGVETDEAEKLLNLEEIIHRDLINQEEAVKAVARALREYRSGLSRRGGPIAVFLFVGPTGVGKTELAKILAKIHFGSEEAMIRLDMTEYQDKTSFFRLVGSPDGKTSGLLTEAVLAKPYSLILLDEFEKAYSDVLNLFLQVFDDGRLTDNFGRRVNFENTIIIATSNAHSAFIKTSLEEGRKLEEIADEFKKKLIDYFRPELLNRFSDIILFKTLLPLELEKIAKLQIHKQLVGLLKKEHGIDLIFDDLAIKLIAEMGYDPVFGARPLRKVLSEQVKSPIAEMLLKKEMARGNQVVVQVKDNKLEFKIT